MITIEALRLRAGLDSADDTRDAELQLAFDTGVAFCESYCDRKFLRVDGWEETFTHVNGKSISLERYPIIHVNSFGNYENFNAYYHVYKKSGLILFDHFVRSHELLINVDAGYSLDASADIDGIQLPADLEYCFLEMFDLILASMGDAGDGGGAVIAGGSIESITLQDVGTIRMGGSSTGLSLSDGSGFGFLPLAVATFLTLYRREKA